MKRIAMGIGLVLELAALVLFAVAIAYGRLDQGVGFFTYIAGAVVGVSAIVAWGATAKALRKVLAHGALLVGCVIFAFPFAWLVTTSFKYNEEIFVYPPKWVPAAPGSQGVSPYVTGEDYADIKLPGEIDRDRWAVLRPDLYRAIWDKARPLLKPSATAAMDEGTLRPVLTASLWVAASQGVAKDAWRGTPEQIIDAVTVRIDAERVEEVFRSIYRSVELRDLLVTDIEHVEHRLAAAPAHLLGRWAPAGGSPVTCTVNTRGQSRPSVLLAYEFDQAKSVTVSGVFPLPIDPEDILSVTVPIRQDRSWHVLKIAIEIAGRRYVPSDAQYLWQRVWQDITLKLPGRNDRDERKVGIWPLEADTGAGEAFDEPGRFRVTLTIERSSAVAATWHKFTSNFRQAYYASPHRWDYLRNSVVLVLLRVIGAMLSCSLVAYAFARLRWPGRDVLFAVMLSTMMLPPQVTMIPVFLIWRTLGLYNTLAPLWMPSFFGTAFFIFLLRQFMRSIPTELEDAAKIDGCGFFGVYWRIILPLMKPALAAVAIFTFMHAWNDFMGPLIYLNDQRLYPLALGLFDFRTQHTEEFGMLMAASTIVTLPVVAVFFLAQRHFIQGVTLTGLKA